MKSVDPFDQSLLHGNGLHVGRAIQSGGHFAPQLPRFHTSGSVAGWPRLPHPPGAARHGSAQLGTGKGSTGRKRAVKGRKEASALSDFSREKKKTALQLAIWRADRSA